jgi:hypothetical protein
VDRAAAAADQGPVNYESNRCSVVLCCRSPRSPSSFPVTWSAPRAAHYAVPRAADWSAVTSPLFSSLSVLLRTGWMMSHCPPTTARPTPPPRRQRDCNAHPPPPCAASRVPGAVVDPVSLQLRRLNRDWTQDTINRFRMNEQRVAGQRVSSDGRRNIIEPN